MKQKDMGRPLSVSYLPSEWMALPKHEREKIKSALNVHMGDKIVQAFNVTEEDAADLYDHFYGRERA